MINWPILDVAIGLALVFTLLSLVCSSIQEGISRFGDLRAKTMAKGLRLLLSSTEGEKYFNEFLNHPMIKSFGGATPKNPSRAPAYLPSRAFAQVLLDVIAPPANNGAALALSEIASAIDKVENVELKTMLQSLLRTANDDVEQFRNSIATWFDDAMDRVSGWYKRQTHSILLVLTIVVVGLSNADTLAITGALWKNPALADAMASAGSDYVKAEAQRQAQTTPDPKAQFRSTIADLQKLNYDGLPIGWHVNEFPIDWGSLLVKVLGLSLTIAAVCLGAPFWFDVLNKLINIRGTGKVPARADAATAT